jgi:hypothetical protein
VVLCSNCHVCSRQRLCIMNLFSYFVTCCLIEGLRRDPTSIWQVAINRMIVRDCMFFYFLNLLFKYFAIITVFLTLLISMFALIGVPNFNQGYFLFFFSRLQSCSWGFHTIRVIFMSLFWLWVSFYEDTYSLNIPWSLL